MLASSRAGSTSWSRSIGWSRSNVLVLLSCSQGTGCAPVYAVRQAQAVGCRLLRPGSEDRGDHADLAARRLPPASAGGDSYRVLHPHAEAIGAKPGAASSHGCPPAMPAALYLSAPARPIARAGAT